MFSAYFLNKNYSFLYLHVFADKIANRLLEIFTGVLFYHLGMPLPFILLFFGLEFGLRGAIAPLAPALASKIGIRTTIAISYVFLVIFFVLVGLAHVSLVIGFSSFVFQSISRGIYYPCVDTLHSVLVRNDSRGRQVTLETVWTIFAGILAVGIGSSVLTNAFVLAVCSIAAVLFVSVSALFFMDPLDFASPVRFLDPYRYLASREWRENLLPVGAQSLVIIANGIVVPLFIFILVKTTSSFSFTILAGLLIEVVLVLLYGRWMDKYGHKKTLPRISLLQAIGNIGYLFASYASAYLPIVNGFNNIAWDMFSGNYNTRLHQKALASQSPLLFNTATQMTLCFVEIVALSFFALIAWHWGTIVFAVIFLSSIIGLYISTCYFVD